MVGFLFFFFFFLKEPMLDLTGAPNLKGIYPTNHRDAVGKKYVFSVSLKFLVILFQVLRVSVGCYDSDKPKIKQNLTVKR